jgi:hypothetical protein
MYFLENMLSQGRATGNDFELSVVEPSLQGLALNPSILSNNVFPSRCLPELARLTTCRYQERLSDCSGGREG